MHESGIGWTSDRRGLNGRVSCDALHVLGLERPDLVGHRQALLQQRRQMLLVKGQAPADWRGAIQGQLVAEQLLPTRVLVVGVRTPARAAPRPTANACASG